MAVTRSKSLKQSETVATGTQTKAQQTIPKQTQRTYGKRKRRKKTGNTGRNLKGQVVTQQNDPSADAQLPLQMISIPTDVVYALNNSRMQHFVVDIKEEFDDINLSQSIEPLQGASAVNSIKCSHSTLSARGAVEPTLSVEENVRIFVNMKNFGTPIVQPPGPSSVVALTAVKEESQSHQESVAFCAHTSLSPANVDLLAVIKEESHNHPETFAPCNHTSPNTTNVSLAVIIDDSRSQLCAIEPCGQILPNATNGDMLTVIKEESQSHLKAIEPCTHTSSSPTNVSLAAITEEVPNQLDPIEPCGHSSPRTTTVDSLAVMKEEPLSRLVTTEPYTQISPSATNVDSLAVVNEEVPNQLDPIEPCGHSSPRTTTVDSLAVIKEEPLSRLVTAEPYTQISPSATNVDSLAVVNEEVPNQLDPIEPCGHSSPRTTTVDSLAVIKEEPRSRLETVEPCHISLAVINEEPQNQLDPIEPCGHNSPTLTNEDSLAVIKEEPRSRLETVEPCTHISPSAASVDSLAVVNEEPQSHLEANGGDNIFPELTYASLRVVSFESMGDCDAQENDHHEECRGSPIINCVTENEFDSPSEALMSTELVDECVIEWEDGCPRPVIIKGESMDLRLPAEDQAVEQTMSMNEMNVGPVTDFNKYGIPIVDLSDDSLTNPTYLEPVTVVKQEKNSHLDATKQCGHSSPFAGDARSHLKTIESCGHTSPSPLNVDSLDAITEKSRSHLRVVESCTHTSTNPTNVDPLAAVKVGAQHRLDTTEPCSHRSPSSTNIRPLATVKEESQSHLEGNSLLPELMSASSREVKIASMNDCHALEKDLSQVTKMETRFTLGQSHPNVRYGCPSPAGTIIKDEFIPTKAFVVSDLEDECLRVGSSTIIKSESRDGYSDPFIIEIESDECPSPSRTIVKSESGDDCPSPSRTIVKSESEDECPSPARTIIKSESEDDCPSPSRTIIKSESEDECYSPLCITSINAKNEAVPDNSSLEHNSRSSLDTESSGRRSSTDDRRDHSLLQQRCGTKNRHQKRLTGGKKTYDERSVAGDCYPSTSKGLKRSSKFSDGRSRLHYDKKFRMETSARTRNRETDDESYCESDDESYCESDNESCNESSPHCPSLRRYVSGVPSSTDSERNARRWADIRFSVSPEKILIESDSEDSGPDYGWEDPPPPKRKCVEPKPTKDSNSNIHEKMQMFVGKLDNEFDLDVIEESRNELFEVIQESIAVQSKRKLIELDQKIQKKKDDYVMNLFGSVNFDDWDDDPALSNVSDT